MPEEPIQLGFFDDELDKASHLPLMEFPRQPQGPAPSIKRLWLENLKGFKHMEIDFGEFNAGLTQVPCVPWVSVVVAEDTRTKDHA